MTRKIEKLGTEAREKILPNVQDLNILIDDMQHRIKTLETECPAEWSPVKNEIDGAHVDMRSKYEETMEAIGKAAPVSIPG